jgi:ribosomal protein S18 acetylase RimI-like enzyme
VRISRLAVDRDFRGQGLGSMMLVDAARRVIESDILAFALIVDT